MTTPGAAVRPVADSPERSFIGTLMWLSPGELAPLLDLVKDDDILDPLLQVVLSVARSLVVEDRHPDPVTLVSRFVEENGTAQQHGFTEVVGDLYRYPPTPGHNAREYARGALTSALRRAIRDLGYLAQHAESEPLPTVLTEYEKRTDRVRDLRHRLSALTAYNPGHNRGEGTAP